MEEYIASLEHENIQLKFANGKLTRELKEKKSKLKKLKKENKND